MTKYVLFAAFLFFFTQAFTQTPDSGQFIVHRHLKVIGKETYQRTRTADGTDVYSMDCFYSDRGRDVPLKAMLQLSATGEPLSMVAKGNTSRMTRINDSVILYKDSLFIKKDSTIARYKGGNQMFPVDGYAPATTQWLLAQWWTRHGKPAVINGLYGPIEIRDLGVDTLHNASGDHVLSAIGIKNVIWGWEFLWIDQSGQLAAITTINAEGDKFEFIHPSYEEQLSFFASRSARYGTTLYRTKTDTPPTVAILHAVLVDIEKGTELPDAAVICVNGKISWTGLSKQVLIPKNALVIDAKGKHLLPGLWDMHAHLKQVEWGPAYIAAGITTVRDMANEFVFISAMKENIDSGNAIGPSILRAGIIDGPGPLANGIMIATTDNEGIELVKKYKAAGFEQIKLYGSLQPPVIKAICEEAHRQGMKVTGHIPQSVTTMQAVDMGIDMIAHIPYLMRAFKADSNFVVDFGLLENQIVLKKLLDKKIVIDPTLAIFEMLYRPDDLTMDKIEPAFSTLPVKLQDDFRNMGLPSAEVIARMPAMKGWRRLVSQLYKAGVPIVAGTDMLIPGYSLYRELELYVSVGLTPLQALQCATLTPATAMGCFPETGSIVTGKVADIILVDGDPLKNISDVRKVRLVLKHGRVYDPAAVHQLIDFRQ